MARIRKSVGIALFASSSLGISLYAYFRHDAPYTGDLMLYTLWILFYTACLLIAIVGFKESASTDAVVYLFLLAAEALFPGLSAFLVASVTNDKTDLPKLELTCHLLLTLLSCTLLLGWSLVLLFKRLDDGGTPVLIRVYLIGTLLLSVILGGWASIDPAFFLELDIAEQNRRLSWVIPSMYAVKLSYARILLAIATMFLPWVRSTCESLTLPENGIPLPSQKAFRA